MHQDLKLTRNESIVDEEIFFDAEGAFAESRITPFEIAGAVAGYSMTKNQILRASRRANWIGLNEPHAVQRAPQRSWREHALCDCHAAQVIEGHGEMLPKLAELVETEIVLGKSAGPRSQSLTAPQPRAQQILLCGA